MSFDVGQHWRTVVSTRLADTSVAEVVTVLEWPNWIAGFARELRQFAHEVFSDGEIPVIRPLSDEAVARLRVVAVFFELIGPDAIEGVMRNITRA